MFELNPLYSWVGVQGVVSMINNERDQEINPSVMDHTHFMKCTSQLNHVNAYEYLDRQYCPADKAEVATAFICSYGSCYKIEMYQAHEISVNNCSLYNTHECITATSYNPHTLG